MDKYQDAFNNAMSQYGGLFNNYTDENGFRYLVFLRQLRESLRFCLICARVSDKVNIYLDFVNNMALNAVVAKGGKDEEHKDVYYIGVYIGCVYILENILYRFFSHPGLFEVIGDPKVEIIPEKISDAEITDANFIRKLPLDLQKVYPRDMMRAEHANKFVLIALKYLINHELGHIMMGHCSWLKQKNGMSSGLTMYDISHIPDAEIITYHSFEFDADNWALMTFAWELEELEFFIATGVERLAPIPVHFDRIYREYIAPIWMIAFSVSLLNRLQGTANNFNENRNKLHPSPITRQQIWIRSLMYFYTGGMEDFDPPEFFTALEAMNYVEVCLANISKKAFRSDYFDMVFSSENRIYINELILHFQKVKWELEGFNYVNLA
ncbi:hypothetical protein GCM10023149_09160 [Mucilaginibacter gynuensis]|uniref:Peptidase U49-like protein n=2 Tax=Mucilaginibacter gynuensis TaxID=1302236 RepID=A0ABP8FY72_9SPHI